MLLRTHILVLLSFWYIYDVELEMHKRILSSTDIISALRSTEIILCLTSEEEYLFS
jgi:hypothetical protein